MPTYKSLATIYDDIGMEIHSRRMVTYTMDILSKLKFSPTDGLDLACGTGEAVREFHREGIAMDGLDQSPDMLRVARKKLDRTSANFYRQNLDSFSIPVKRGSRQKRQYDLVTCFFDSLNYLLTESKLKRSFKSVYAHLRPGGLFVIDMNTPYGLKAVWDGLSWSGATDKAAWMFNMYYDFNKEIAGALVTLFFKQGRHWIRKDEHHKEAGYSNAVIRRLMREAGFKVSGLYRCFSFDPPTAKDGRISVVARKPLR